MATQPTDFLSGLGGINALPNAARDISLAQGLHTTELQQQAMGLQNQTRQLQLNEAQTAQQRQQAFQTDIMALGDSPDAGSIARTIRKYPEYAQQLKQSHDMQDEAKRNSDFRMQSQVYSAASTGRYDLAASLLKSHRDASIKAGEEADAVDDAIIAALDSGDPAEQKRALSMIGLAVASVDPEKFAQTYKALQEPAEKGGVVVGDGSALVDPITGKVLFQAPRKPEYRSVGAGETVLALGGDTGSAAAPTGDVIESAVLGFVPGAVVTSRARTPEHNREVGGVANSRHLDDAARDFAPPEGMSTAALAKQVRASLPAGYRVLDEGDHIHVQAATRSGGGAQVVAQGAPKAGYTMLTPQEVRGIPGLDPNTVYQRSPDGQISAVGGQGRTQLKPWPVQALETRTLNNAAISNIEPLFNLFNPAKTTDEAKAAKRAVGFGTGALGDRLTNYNDPGGTDVRGRIGKISSIAVKDTSGANVTVGEEPRLAKWVPYVSDSPATIRSKLGNLLRELKGMNKAQDGTYNEDQGYRPFSQTPSPTGFRILSVRPK